jgi:pyruvate dehydrogenase E1 component alpha subunit
VYIGTTYRTREEVGDVRTARDPIEYVKKLLVDTNLATAEEIKGIEKEVRESVNQSLLAAKAGKVPPDSWLTQDIFSDDKGRDAHPDVVRMPDIKKNIIHRA